ncbi:TPA: MFS transporter [Enterobacter hormaechei]|nr:MFS transporter [Enterobacter hormaechei]HBL5006410.1 MFS transporter [Enterobacter hormaechei]HBL8897252.1 MFS transporter [Enterobacter hormaechei]HDV8229591.1 MFS transporter [Enterobacter hormaechei]
MTKTTQGLSPALILLMSVATGLAVASNYYAQPLLDTIARAFDLSASSAGFIVTAAQLGYAAGLLFLVPLGDMFERRMLIVSMTLLAAGGMLITASSQSLTMMIIGTALTGLFSVVAQILVPLAATLASPEKRGKVVGTIMSGLLLGILLARTVAGLLASLGGWRTVYWVASVLMLIMALALWRGLPKVKQENHLNYPQLLASVFSLFTRDKLLRTRAILGCLTFANFSILWTSMAFLLAAPPFNYSEGVIGLFGLAGAAGALGARPAGGLADKGKSHMTTSAGLVLLLLSWAAIWYGHVSVLALIVGILVLDLTVQGVHITNQTVIYRMKPDARNRLTAGYMTSYFIGGAAGSLISASAWQHAGWTGVCAIGAIVAIVAAINLLVWWRGYHRQEAIH